VVFYRPFPSVTGFVENYRICVSEFFGIVSRIFSELCLRFFGIFQHVIFHIAYTSLDKDYLFLYFLDALRFFWEAVGINDLVSQTNPHFSMHMLCISNI
jgi:hypothetical protein